MCDTLVIIRDGAVWFAKNSDREPDEPQLVETHPPVRDEVRDDATASLAATHIEIDQVPNRYGVILSRPDWMWGAEMGVNDQGVAIGNETVFSKKVDRKGLALLGMDLVRLGLERGGTAREALDVITSLLEKHGQAGPGTHRGGKRGYRYDNSFLIADGIGAWVLETAGRDWAAKQVKSSWAISNTYSIGSDYDLSSAGLGSIDLKAKFETRLMPWLARGRERAALSDAAICRSANQPMSLAVLAAILRTHHGADGFAGGSNRDVCMHARGLFRPSQTTGSLIAKLGPGHLPEVAVTGTSSPCISLFKPVSFAADGAMADRLSNGDLWRWGKAVDARCASDDAFLARVRAEIRAVQADVLAADNMSAAESWLTKIGGLREG